MPPNTKQAFRQEAPASQTLDVDIPGMGGAVARVPADATPDEIADIVNTMRRTHGAQEQYPAGIGQAPLLLSAGAGTAASILSQANPLATGAASGLGEMAGRGVQNLYGRINPPQAEFTQGKALHRIPLEPLPTPASQIGQEGATTGVLSGAMEYLLPKLGPAASFVSKQLGLPNLPLSKQWLSEKLLHPDKALPETQEMMAVDKMVREAGGPGLNIAQLGGKERGLVPNTMQAIASGGGSRALHRVNEANEVALQRKGEALKQQWGLPQSNDLGRNLLDMMEQSYGQNVKRVQDQAYNTIRLSLPRDQGLVNAAPIFSELTAPGSPLGREVLGELQTLQPAKPQLISSLMGKMKAAQGQAEAIAKGEAPSADLSHWLTFDEAVELRTALYKLGRTHFGDSRDDRLVAQAAQALGGRVSSDIREGLSHINPRLAGIHARADKYTASIKDYFNDPVMVKFTSNLEKDPHVAFRELLKPGNAEEILKVRRYLEPLRAKAGQSTMGSSWSDVKNWFAGELLQEATENVASRGGPATGYISGKNLVDTLNKYNRDTISAVFGDGGQTFTTLRHLARGLEVVGETPTGMGKIAIQLALPGAVVGGTASAVGLATGDDPATAAGKGILAGSAIVLTPQVFGAILTNPSLLKHFTTGVWEYRKSGLVSDNLRAAIRQGMAAGGAEQLRTPSPESRVMQQRQTGLPQPPQTDLPYTRALPQISAAR